MGNKRSLAGIAILFFLFAAQAAAHGICRHIPYSDSLDAVRDGEAIPASRSLYWYMDEARAERAGIWACEPITSAFADVAAQAGIPSGIMTAVALNETSRHGMPWPWTLNAGGQSFYFDTRDEGGGLPSGGFPVEASVYQIRYRHHAGRLEIQRLAI